MVAGAGSPHRDVLVHAGKKPCFLPAAKTEVSRPSAESAVGDFQPHIRRPVSRPSPTGALHLGSLVAAVGSFLDARTAGGRWLLRMEDLDTSRVLPGCSDEILRTLEAFGLEWER